jgi:dTDP-4-amino-4,6-dideoxygalactose transaminase
MATGETLAAMGDTPTVSVEAHRRWPDIREEDREAVLRVLERGVLCGAYAPEISALEVEWAEYVGVTHCLALNSGTAALHCACAAVGLEPGDEVIVPAFTFVASAMAVAHHGAVPVFCDIDPNTFNLDPHQIESRLSNRTRAIMPVHLHGLPADMDEILEIAGRHGLAVIEDAAQAHGATYRGRKVGTLGGCGAFSLNATKTLSGGEGGLFVTDDAAAYEVARRLSVFGEDVPPTGPGEFRGYVTHGLGWNYRNQELSSAFTRSQLRRLDTYIETARANAAVLTAGLNRVRGLIPPAAPDDRLHTYHKYRVRLDAAALGYDGPLPELRDRLVLALRAEGVDASLWQVVPLPANPAFRNALRPWHPSRSEPLRRWDPGEYPEATRVLEGSFLLGSEAHPLFIQEPALMDSYVEAIEKVLANLETLLELPFEPVTLRPPVEIG